jgi:Protein of unknown function (DUF2782)
MKKNLLPKDTLAARFAHRAPLAAALVLCASTVFAQSNPLPKLEPLPDVPPPQIAIDPSLEPEIKIIQRGTDKVEEFRVSGKLYMVRVTPPGGIPYVLIDNSGSGAFTPAHGQADPRSISVPMWVIKTF